MVEPDEPATEDAAAEDRPAGVPGAWARRTFWLLSLASLAGIGALVALLAPDPGLWISLLAVWLVFWLALWLVAFVSKEPSSKDIGVALLTGLVLAGAAFVLNFVLEEALASRDRERRETDTKLAINRREQFVFRGADFRDFDLTGMALVSSEAARFDLSFADLTGANLGEAELRRVLLRKANLTDAILEDADLAQANLREANLLNANFARANLSGADLTGAMHFNEGDDPDNYAVLSENTRCPGDGGAEVKAKYSTDDNRFTCADTADGTPDNAHQLFLVSKGAPPGTVVGRVTGTDRDADDLEYAILDPGDPAFAIDSRTGVITVAEAALDAGDSLERRVELRVQVSDGINDHVVEEVVIVIEGSNEPPEAVVTYLVRADSPVGTRIGRIEPPALWPGTRAFAIEAGDSSGLFGLDGNGVLTLDGKPQAGNSYVLNVRIGDSGLSTTLPVLVTVIGENKPPTVLTVEPFEVTVGAEPGATIDVVAAEDADGDAMVFSIEAIDPEGEFFELDPGGALKIGAEAPDVGEYTLSVSVTDTGIPPRSVEAQVTVKVLQSMTAAAAHRYLVADGGMLDVPAEDGLLSANQLADGITADLATNPRAGRLDGNDVLPSGAFSYAHITPGFGPDTFQYVTVDAAGVESEPSEVAVVVVVSEPGDLRSTSEPGAVATSLSVAGIPRAGVAYALAGGSQLFELGSEVGTIVTSAPGAQLFAAGPWHDLDVEVTDLQFGRSITVQLVVPVAYVVVPGDSLNAVASQALGGAAAAGTPCPQTTGEYAAEIREANRITGTLEPGDVLVVPDCRPGT